MFKYVLYGFILCVSFGQNTRFSDTLFVYIRMEETSPTARFEQHLMKDLVTLYNRTNVLKHRFILQFKKVDGFSALIETVEHNTEQKKYICGIRGVTIRPTKRFMFSHPYFPIESGVIGNKASSKTYNSKTATVHYFSTSTNTPFINEVRTNYSFKLKIVQNESPYHKVLHNEWDYYLGDTIDAWQIENLKVIHTVGAKSHLGILFPLGSPLKNIFDPILKYYVRSAKYFSAIKHYYGNGFSVYISAYKDEMARKFGKLH